MDFIEQYKKESIWKDKEEEIKFYERIGKNKEYEEKLVAYC